VISANSVAVVLVVRLVVKTAIVKVLVLLVLETLAWPLVLVITIVPLRTDTAPVVVVSHDVLLRVTVQTDLLVPVASVLRLVLIRPVAPRAVLLVDATMLVKMPSVVRVKLVQTALVELLVKQTLTVKRTKVVAMVCVSQDVL